MNPDFIILAIVKFYSRVVLKKISNVALAQYRKVENDYKKLHNKYRHEIVVCSIFSSFQLHGRAGLTGNGFRG